MPKNKIIMSLGAFVVLIHILDGLPQSWESFLAILSGLAIVLISIWSTIDRKMSLKAKAHARQAKRVTDIYPKTGQPGRRVTDLNLNPGEPEEPTL
ncbi:hypothetical protein KW807_02525 [Candidatus Parcubacteria bacterium]|nr:hypothetical protein [Candidatus Parcubacteria bacterium]